MNPVIVILFLLVGVPLFELYFLIEVGSEIGAIPTIFLTVFTAVLGGLLVRVQGFSTALRVRRNMEKGEIPAVEMLEGFVLLFSGLLLLFPGFFTDVIGFLCLIPPLRRGALIWFLSRSGVMGPAGPVPSGAPKDGSSPETRVIEGEYQRHDEE